MVKIVTLSKCDIPFRVWWKSPHLLAKQSPNSGLGDNPLIFNQTPNLGSACILTTGLIVGWLPCCMEQELHLFKRFSLRTENIGMQMMNICADEIRRCKIQYPIIGLWV
ncbi:hypothetical protein A9255_00445 [Xenorhabdus hominickii]|uniref:Uncharacterized protein n=1 Tax=Xenorhabdus hominickii TaxID=351679 RepID=A0ABN4RZB8_XENHO|nr:hypothetical protein A9255_00445 [Xenorhabdus hominickii]